MALRLALRGEASGSAWMARFLAELLDDPYAAVRFNAFKSLQQIPGYESIPNVFDSPAHERSKSKLAVPKQWRDGCTGSREPDARRTPGSEFLLSSSDSH